MEPNRSDAVLTLGNYVIIIIIANQLPACLNLH